MVCDCVRWGSWYGAVLTCARPFVSQPAVFCRQEFSLTDKPQQVCCSPEEAILVEGFANTPRYFLKHGADPIGPGISPASTGSSVMVLFGFFDKLEYDRFQSASDLALTPYPLVKEFLTNRIELDDGTLRLMVLEASTFQMALKSFQTDSESVPVSHRLVRDEFSTDYRIETVAGMATSGPA